MKSCCFLGQEIGARFRRARRKLREILLGHLDELLVRETAGADENHAIGRVVVLDVVHKLGAGDVANILAGAEDGAAQRLMLIRRRVEMVKDDLLHLLLHLFGLAKDHVALPLDGGLLQLRVLQDVGQDVDALRDVAIEGFGEVDRVFALPAGQLCLPRRQQVERLTEV